MTKIKQEYKDSSFGIKSLRKKTPRLIKKIGNALIIIGTLSGATALIFSPTVGAILTIAGGIGKIISMFFGEKY